MRTPKYLSPTSIGIFYGNRDQYYLNYLCDTKVERDPQTAPMAVGSAFDARVKSWLVERLIGKQPEFEFNTLFEAQVEPHNRDEARKAGDEVFAVYTAYGALADLLLDLDGCIGTPRFESKIEAPLSCSLAIGDVPLLGKPDIYFIAKKGARVVHDWKVNGYYSNANISPKPGYVRQRTNNPKTNGRSHDKAMPMDLNGIKISAMHPLDSVDVGWAQQIAIYAWLLGEAIGSQFIAAIDQIAVGRNSLMEREYRIAQHRATITEKFQNDAFLRAHRAWQIIQSGHIFDNMPRHESDLHCRMLDEMANTAPDPSFDEIIR